MSFPTIPVCRLKHKRLVLFNLPVDRPSYKRFNLAKYKSEVHGKSYTKGTLSPLARKRLQRSIELLIDISPKKSFIHPSTGKEYTFQITFVTLTLSALQGDITDKQIVKQCLEPFLQICRRRFKVTSYIWRAERQKNGNLHFHITTNQYIPYDRLRDAWNYCQEKVGLISQFERKHGHRHPNSTDVHSVIKVRELARYLIKYMSKDQPEALKVTCKLWDCSKGLKHKGEVDIVLDSVETQVLEVLESVHQATKYIGDFFTTYYIRGKDIRRHLPDRWKSAIRELHQKVIEIDSGRLSFG